MAASKLETSLTLRVYAACCFCMGDYVSFFSGDLGAIDAKYDIAVSTSCAALDYVVVDTTATAQCCVEMLRRKGLGVATFLILDKQQHLAKALQEKPTTPEGQYSTMHSCLLPLSSSAVCLAHSAVTWQVATCQTECLCSTALIPAFSLCAS